MKNLKKENEQNTRFKQYKHRALDKAIKQVIFLINSFGFINRKTKIFNHLKRTSRTYYFTSNDIFKTLENFRHFSIYFK